jgi:acyl carrier protein
MSDVEERVKKVTAAVLNFDADKIAPENRFVEDLGAESIQSIELIAAFEAEFDIELDEGEATGCKTIASAIKFISGYVTG